MVSWKLVLIEISNCLAVAKQHFLRAVKPPISTFVEHKESLAPVYCNQKANLKSIVKCSTISVKSVTINDGPTG